MYEERKTFGEFGAEQLEECVAESRGGQEEEEDDLYANAADIASVENVGLEVSFRVECATAFIDSRNIVRIECGRGGLISTYTLFNNIAIPSDLC